MNDIPKHIQEWVAQDEFNRNAKWYLECVANEPFIEYLEVTLWNPCGFMVVIHFDKKTMPKTLKKIESVMTKESKRLFKSNCDTIVEQLEGLKEKLAKYNSYRWPKKSMKGCNVQTS